MKRMTVILLCAAVAALACMAPSRASAQTDLAQYYPYPPQQPYYYDKEERERWKEERRREKEWRKEERRREREERRYQQWYNEQQWHRYNQRYFGGNVIVPYPGESYESFTRRVRQQCNVAWNRCANYCNTIRDANRRALCVANCNNELYECNSGF